MEHRSLGTRRLPSLGPLPSASLGDSRYVAGPLLPPDHLYIELTDRCNLRCKHCYLPASPSGSRSLDLRVATQTLSDFAALDGRAVSLSGGEPLLYPDWAEVLAHASSRGLECTLMTNGVLLDEDAMATLVGLNATIAVSLDGARTEAHDALRGRGSFSRAEAALTHLAAAGEQGRVIVCITPTKLSLAQIPSMVWSLTGRGFYRFHISLLEHRGRQRKHVAQLSLNAEEQAQLLTQLALLLSHPGGPFDIQAGHLKYLLARLLGQRDGVGEPVESTLRVAPDGQVYLTAYVDNPDFILGRLPNDTLRQCCESSRAVGLCAAAERRALGLGACRCCPYWIWCLGGNPVRAYAAHGSFSEPDEFCEAKQIFLERWFQAQYG